jgi:hypothetical protein
MPPMTRTAIRETVKRVIEGLGLGPNSCRHSSLYHDYGAFEFALFVDDRAANFIEIEFRALCRRHGWQVCRVTRSRGDRSVIVTIQQSDVISTGDRRMPA